MAIIDVITYNGEHDLFKLRYEILKDVVDEFIVVEFDKTFSGKPKEPLFTFQEWPKVTYRLMTDYEKYRDMAEASPNTQGAAHWKMEFMQKESIRDVLTHLNDDDIVFIGDCDEIWEPYWKGLIRVFPTPLKLKLLVYTYYLNNQSSEEFHGTIISEYGYLKNGCLNHIRTKAEKVKGACCGWHFTSLKDALHQKLTDSYTSETYASQWVLDNLEENIKQNKDFLGRDFTYTLSELRWPKYLKEHRDEYKHLLKSTANPQIQG